MARNRKDPPPNQLSFVMAFDRLHKATVKISGKRAMAVAGESAEYEWVKDLAFGEVVDITCSFVVGPALLDAKDGVNSVVRTLKLVDFIPPSHALFDEIGAILSQARENGSLNKPGEESPKAPPADWSSQSEPPAEPEDE